MYHTSQLGQIISYSHGYIDEFGKPIERTPLEYQYSYDSFVVWRGGENSEANATVYTDRMLRDAYGKHDVLCQKHFGDRAQIWYSRNPEKIQDFLRDWYEEPEIRLIFVMQCVNQSSGFPLWRFDFYIPNKTTMERTKNENEIYASIIGLCEQKEKEGKYIGNGHHLAQQLTVKITEGLLPKLQKKIYSALSTTPKSTKEIAEACKLSTKLVSAILIQILKTTSLIGVNTKKGKAKQWFKYY